MSDPATERTGPGGLPYRACAGVVLINDDGRVFAGQRIEMPGAWQMPQGGIDKGETPKQAALRELVEETGVTPDQVDLLGETPDWLYYDLPDEMVGKIWKGKYGGQRQKWFLMRFKGEDRDIRIETEHPEFDKWCWIKADDLLDNIVPFKRDVYASVIESFRTRLR
ncbi:RNA pyrophosphohydrolase [Paracoccus fistulariae]|uniref:RNA pyrophosphohydrolase n=1 Tax=Paracoccus fistulariae TaxID=658446 RepID=A0ABY7SFV8_9RHOB|nr:RNA pyrophosphohydrolase [Paracoccus fistulariae]MDB6182680.1 RNA pyrophosphohydrolase [Paracoccus fistulariae]WCR05754.1 RNA pyrophosphohydrolase [Paracoccus fistulariae]